MSTGETNTLSLTPISAAVRPRIYTAVVRYGVDVGHSRSTPAGLDGTYRPGSAKPVAPTESPRELTATGMPMEPAREPVPGASPA
jgi:hypothetical protein